MRHRKHTFKLGRSGAHRRAMLANMACSLIIEGEIRTTLVKAKELRRYAEKLVTIAKKGSLHNRRNAIAKIKDREAVKKLFDEIAPQYGTRPGGYTRIIRLSNRIGDGAQMCLIQWVEEEIAQKKKSSKSKAKKQEETPVEVAAEEVTADEEVEETAEAKAENAEA